MGKNLNRWQAFLMHAGLSVLIFLIILSFIIFIWYPGIFVSLGGIQGIKIVAAVDLVLGPFLTLIVFNPLKKSLKWDLTAIACIQVVCLGLGVWLVQGQKPVVQVLSNDGVYIYTYSDFKDLADFTKIKGLSGNYPKLAILDLPDAPAEIALLKATQGLIEGNSLEERIDLYREYGALDKEAVYRRLAYYEYNEPQECYWMPLYSAQYAGTACFSLDDGIVQLRPQK